MDISFLLFLSTLITLALARPEYQAKIPNGQNVPNPCPDGGIWAGVGHEAKQGGGLRNPFGVEFFNNGLKWDVVLCRKDSDGDGWTNGMELGDPSCQWTEGATPTFSTNITHPGVCEPLTSAACQGMNPFLPESCVPSTTPLPTTTTPLSTVTSTGGISDTTSSVSRVNVGASTIFVLLCVAWIVSSATLMMR